MLDTKALAQATALIVREHVDAAVGPLLERLAALEAREAMIPEKGETGEPGRDGKDIDLDGVKEMAAAAVAEALPAALEAAIAALPPAPQGEPGRDGADVDMIEVTERIETAVKSAVAALPAPKDGEPGADGIGLADALIDRCGELVLTMTDGRMKNLGLIIGKDGAPGTPGEPGRDGRDLDDIIVTQDGPVVEFAFQVGEVRSIFEVELPAGPPGEDGQHAYPGEAKGLFDAEAEYRALDVVSHNGSEWRAKCDNPGELPGRGWMLSACKGKRGEPGKRGEAGRDAVSPIAQYLRGTELITTLSDGAELKADLADLAGGDPGIVGD